MTHRYFYKCPIVALYMMREFGVEFEIRIEILSTKDLTTGELKGASIEYISFEDWLIEHDIDLVSYQDDVMLYVTKESESIVKPQKGDMITHTDRHEDSDGYILCAEDLRLSAWLDKYFDKIIMRTGKQFFMPVMARMNNNGKTCKNCGHKYWDWDFCCFNPVFDIAENNKLIKKEYAEMIRKWRLKRKKSLWSL